MVKIGDKLDFEYCGKRETGTIVQIEPNWTGGSFAKSKGSQLHRYVKTQSRTFFLAGDRINKTWRVL